MSQDLKGKKKMEERNNKAVVSSLGRGILRRWRNEEEEVEEDQIEEVEEVKIYEKYRRVHQLPELPE